MAASAAPASPGSLGSNNRRRHPASPRPRSPPRTSDGQRSARPLPELGPRLHARSAPDHHLLLHASRALMSLRPPVLVAPALRCSRTARATPRANPLGSRSMSRAFPGGSRAPLVLDLWHHCPRVYMGHVKFPCSAAPGPPAPRASTFCGPHALCFVPFLEVQVHRCPWPLTPL